MWAASVAWAVAVGMVLLAPPSPVSALSGPNVCTKQETFTSFVNVSFTKAYRVRTYTYCFSIPPKCSKYKIAYRTSFKQQSFTKTRTVDVCCSGYTRLPAKDMCKPICSQECIHGVCEKPDECRCEAGYSGPSCNITCPEGKWGMGCIHDCPCLHEGKCDPLYGNCSCHAGWIGPYCEEKCQDGYYGVDCKDRCRCQNGGMCDHVSGACQCPPGWTGPLCSKSCPEGTHGTACSNKCQCQNGGHCDPVTGKCQCPSGWTGDVCANPCPQGTWGYNCSEFCDCYNSATCDHITGRCKCPSGYIGNKCQEECPLGTYGVNCTETCNCSNGATCSHISGKCFCKDGWKPPTCTQPACPPEQFGRGCSQICSCEKQNTERCHPWTGECECRPGWAGVTCSRACPFYKFGEKCQNNCDCKNGAFCEPVDGTCICAPGYHGKDCTDHCPKHKYGQNCDLTCRCKNSLGCSHESGKCMCSPGWGGQQCSLTCPLGYYGSNCTKVCECQNNGSCEPVTGACTCGPGHFGDKCQKTCDQSNHGMGCISYCACVAPNAEGCDPVTGECLCKPGFRGVSCESRCPRGLYGESCTQKCDCKNKGSCNPQTGKCNCERGWHGADCNTPCRPGKYGVNCNQDCPPCVHGNGTCHAQQGTCMCAAGWRGARCDRTCDAGWWGIDCKNECRCRNGAECNPETGECHCLPGWRGGDCSQPCPPGTFGYNCLQTCHCRNHASCRGNDGFCECKPSTIKAMAAARGYNPAYMPQPVASIPVQDTPVQELDLSSTPLAHIPITQVSTVDSIITTQPTSVVETVSSCYDPNLTSGVSHPQLQRKFSPVMADTASSASRSESPVSSVNSHDTHALSQSPVSCLSTATSSPSTQSDLTLESGYSSGQSCRGVPPPPPPIEKTTHQSPIPERKKLSSEMELQRNESKVRNLSPQAFKFYMEQHIENVIKSCEERESRRAQLEKEMKKIGLSDKDQSQMRKMLSQKESNFIRLKRAKMDKHLFHKIKTIGVGAFGEVALVCKIDTHRLYAMKTLRKADVLKRNQVAHVKAERDILAEADNEWVVKLYYSFQDKDNLYFVMDYIPGGDLMSLLIKFGIFKEQLARFYIGELVCAIESVHKMGFIHRDIKPDNILIDRDGHIKLTDFGLCTGFRWTHNSKYYQRVGDHNRQDSIDPCGDNDIVCRCNDLKPLERRRRRQHLRCLAHSLVGTPNYIAPEVLSRTGYTQLCDWWSVGVILYEMLVGQPPFLASTPSETQYKVINWETTLRIPKQAKLSPEAKDLILSLCTHPEQRLGRNGAQEVKAHPFFKEVDFEGGLRKQQALYSPTIKHPTDTSNFDPIDPDKLRPSEPNESDLEWVNNGNQPLHAFFEFTFRRFFDSTPGGSGSSDEKDSQHPVYV